jgi:hypothetical protein
LSYEAQNGKKHGYKGYLNRRNKFPNRFFPIPKISLAIFDELDKPRF